jgi:DNA-binding transcriptional ArsR family regulator
MTTDHLSATFAALADPTRRAILARLVSGGASVTELAEPFDMSLPAVSKHLKVLERAGLIARGARGAMEAVPAGGRAAQRCRRLGGRISPFLGGELRSLGRLSSRIEKQGEETWPKAQPVNPQQQTAWGWKSISPASSTRRGGSSSKRGLIQSAWRSGGGPTGFTNPRCELDVRPGGAIRIDMRAPDGTVYPMSGVYQEIVEPNGLSSPASRSMMRGILCLKI